MIDDGSLVQSFISKKKRKIIQKKRKRTFFSVRVKRDCREYVLDVGGKRDLKKLYYVMYEYVNILKNHNNI